MVEDKEGLNLPQGERYIFSVELKPLQGDRFQPTGFPNIGAATYERPDGTKMLLVESSQSMANRLEETIVGPDGYNIIQELQGLPYVVSIIQIKKDKNDTAPLLTHTSSLTEPHRLNSHFILVGKRDGSEKHFGDELKDEFEYDRKSLPNWKKIAQVLFKYDPNTLLHGVFFSNIEDGKIKMPRAVSAFIEAEDVRPVESGGLKKNPFDSSGELAPVDKVKVKDGSQMVPYSRTEYTAKSIRAYFNIDLSLIRSYADMIADGNESKKDSIGKLLYLLTLYKVRGFLNRGLRLRTSCDFTVVESTGYKFPDPLGELKQLIAACRSYSLFSDSPTRLKSEWKVSEKNVEVTSEGSPDESSSDQDDASADN
ncbi:MAG: type I-U CRISPR-associated protein Cas7 [Nitrososphaerota archaeon]|nr:type I-U CRISPR-associated protein Cas7 [Nitrososphaerota archaeon]MDG7037937.1 type I-U CRISPR-associated protein Cas7 [Nitrososphaerota archaeon]